MQNFSQKSKPVILWISATNYEVYMRGKKTRRCKLSVEEQSQQNHSTSKTEKRAIGTEMVLAKEQIDQWDRIKSTETDTKTHPIDPWQINKNNKLISLGREIFQ